MTKHNTIQIDCTISENNYQLKSLLNIDVLIPKDDSVRLLSQIVEEMNLEELYQTYSRIRGNSVTPRQLLKIVIYANMNKIYSSRKIETSCKRDINFMYLLGVAFAPYHSTIARFRSLHFAPVCESLMAQFTNFLGDKNEISKENNTTHQDEVVEILVEGKSKTDDTKFTGRTRQNKLVNFSVKNPDADLIGKLVNVKITEAALSFSLNGEMVE